MRAAAGAMINIIFPITFSRKTYDSFDSILFEGDNEEYFESYYDAIHQDYYKTQDEMSDSIAFIAKYEAETMYYHQDMKQPY